MFFRKTNVVRVKQHVYENAPKKQNIVWFKMCRSVHIKQINFVKTDGMDKCDSLKGQHLLRCMSDKHLFLAEEEINCLSFQ